MTSTLGQSVGLDVWHVGFFSQKLMSPRFCLNSLVRALRMYWTLKLLHA